jgi:hypothetical protein
MEWLRRWLARYKWPGLVAILYGAFTQIPDFQSRVQFWLEAAKMVGSKIGVVATILASPLFGIGLIVAGFVYLAFVGERQVVARHPIWPILGWTVVAASILSIATLVLIGYVVTQVRPPERQLTLEQQRILHAELQKVHDPIFVHVTWAPNHVEPFNYANAIQGQFAEAKNPNLTSQSEAPDALRTTLQHGQTTLVVPMPLEFFLEFVGLKVVVPDVNHKPAGAVAVVNAMEAAHLNVGWTTNERLGKHPMDNGGSEDECTLLVGTMIRD